MATSGRASVEVIPGITMVAEWHLVSQDIYDNSSTLYGKISLVSDGASFISGAGNRPFSFKIGNYSYAWDKNIDVKKGETTVVFDVSVQGKIHEEDGTVKSIYNYFISSFDFGVVNGLNVGEKEIRIFLDLPKIIRPVEISVSENVLDKQSTILVSRYVDTLTHTIIWSCGEYSGTICEKSESESELFTAPIDLSLVNTTGTSVVIKFEVATYDGETMIGSRTYNIAYNIPESIAPSCTFSIDDSLFAKYGAHVQKKSTLNIVTTPIIAYGSPITSCFVKVGGDIYKGENITTKPLLTAGDIDVKVTVKDARGRTFTATNTITVIGYTPPAVIGFTAVRANADGSDNEQGEYVKTTFSSVVTSLDDKNSATYSLGYKKTAHFGYTEIDVSEYTGEYFLSDIFRIFAADTGSSYDVRLSITDDFHTTIYEAKAPTGFTTFHVPASGHGFSFGKVSEIEDLFDVAFVARFAGFMHPVLDEGVDFDAVVVPNTYACSDASKAGYINAPFTEGEFVLEVMATSNGVIQKAIACESGTYSGAVRCKKNGEWGVWTADTNIPSTPQLPSKDTLDNMSWADIQTVCKAGAASEYWSIGDQKTITVNGVNYVIDLIGFDHDTPTDAEAYGRQTAGATFQLHTSLATRYYMYNSSNFTGGWETCMVRTNTIPTLFDQLDYDLKNVIVPVNKLSGKGGGSASGVESTTDSLFLLSEIEYFGSNANSVHGEGKQYSYYAAGNSKIKTNNGSAYSHWTRSAGSGVVGQFVIIAANGTAGPSYAPNSFGVPFAFCV